MQGWTDASYFHPPAADAAPSWVILNKMARCTNCDNATTASAITRSGHTVKVTFCLASPPSASHVCVFYTYTEPRWEDPYSVRAEVASSAKDLVLLRCKTSREPDAEYFVYHDAAGMPSLRAIPYLPPIIQQVPRISFNVATPCVTLLPFDDGGIGGGGEFLLAFLTAVERPVVAYHLHVFSSKTCAWSTRPLTPPAGVTHRDMPLVFDKVIALGGSVLGFADLHVGGGIIACDVLDEDPTHTRFIPLPKSDFYKRPDRPSLPVHQRDVASYTDGFIVLVDLDLRFRYVAVDRDDEKKPAMKKIRDLDHVDAIFDSELICDQDYPNVVHVPDGWKIRTCYRHISWDYWCKGHIVDVDDIAIHDPRHHAILSELWDGGAGRWTLRKLKAKRPTLSMHGAHVVYLTVVSKKGHNGRHIDHSKKEEQKLTVGIDLGKKTVEMLEPHNYYNYDVQPWTISQHVNTPPPDVDAVHADYAYDISQHPPVWSLYVPQHLDPSLNSSGSGCVYPVNTQYTYPVTMVNTATHGQQYLSLPPLPLGPAPASSLLEPFAPQWRRC